MSEQGAEAGNRMGIRDLRNHLTATLRRVRQGTTITVTDRHRPVALLVPYREHQVDDLLRELVRAGRVSWAGGKPQGSQQPPEVRGAPVADAVCEDRR